MRLVASFLELIGVVLVLGALAVVVTLALALYLIGPRSPRWAEHDHLGQ